MAGRGPAPKPERRRRNKPTRGEIQPTPVLGWQHGPIPPPPNGVHAETIAAWQAWMTGWWASHWLPNDLPALEHIARLFELCRSYAEDPYVEKSTRKGDTIYVLKPNPSAEWRQLADSYGITPKGQQDRRWAPPKEDKKPAAAASPAKVGRYAHLRAV
jgi:hypothetical protein